MGYLVVNHGNNFPSNTVIYPSLQSLLLTVLGMVEQARAFNLEDGTNFWAAPNEKEMKNVRITFEFNGEDPTIPIVGHKRISAHWVFNIKLIMLGRKARLVMNGKETDALKNIIGHVKRLIQ